ncbi:tryptophan aminotransferase-related protein 2-like [Senna tora]|uniref:Tryptophan aminotransferase-related protein 2-like n=1 Tax=Senna tora TaxID=362788 RepID=A0A834SKJ9_9FABA|nr:tryptophan aminotransferase-related protein 2-like [Senna tora]
MAKLPATISLRHLLVLSLALNVSLVLKMIYESEEYSCLKTTKEDAASNGDERLVHKSRLAISSPSSSYSTPKVHPKDKDKVINLNHLWVDCCIRQESQT